MTKRKLIWQIYPYYLIIIIAALVAVTYYSTVQIHRMYTEEVTLWLESAASLGEYQLRDLIASGDVPHIRQLCETIGTLSGTRITVIDSSGAVLGDSEQDPATMENHGRRPEIAQALTGTPGEATRHSNTLQKTMKYFAVPVTLDGVVVGVVRTALPISDVNQTLSELNTRIAIVGAVLIVLATILSFVVFKRLTRPLDELRLAADRMAEGDFSARLPAPVSAEISALIEAIRNMAAQLDSRLKIIGRQRNEQEAILTSMTEAVLAVDTDEKIIRLNEAAGRVLNIDPVYARGKTIQEVVRQPDLQRLVKNSLGQRETMKTELTLPGTTERLVQVSSSDLRDASDKLTGTVLVMNDITRLRLLENVRRDFVANVSHELRTPITAISGCVETLLESGAAGKDETQKLLAILQRQTDRLNHIVSDLLTISQLEYPQESRSLDKRPIRLNQIVQSAVLACEQKSRSRNIVVRTQGDELLQAEIDYPKMEQALVNLIDNAIKFSPEDSEVLITWESDSRETVITVKDNGPGIEKKHLPRLFERFYRVDKARSREMGGTGLGLAIVKHIALAHHGRVTVESAPGEGSAFRIHLPSAT